MTKEFRYWSCNPAELLSNREEKIVTLRGLAVNLVNELQVSAERDDVLTVLRKAKRLASKLGVDEINNWLRCEQEGYKEGDAIPNYRLIVSNVVYKTLGPIPVGMGMMGDGIMDYPGGFTVNPCYPDSMSEVVAAINQCKEQNHGLYLQMEEDHITAKLRSRMHPMVGNRVQFLLRLNMSQVRAIPEAVKDRILDWACELERRGVHGDNMTFDDKEKAAAHTINFNLTNCNVEQLNNQGNNIKGSNG